MSNTPAPVAVTPERTLAQHLKNNMAMIRGIAGSLIDPEKLIRLALLVCQKNEFLYMCSYDSIVRAVVQSAEVNLEIGSALNHAYIVPRCVSGQWTAEFQISAQGYIELAYRSGFVESIDVWPVFVGDEFSYQFGTDPQINHVPKFEEDDKDSLLYTYGVAHLTTGGRKFVMLPKKRIERLRMMNPAEKSGKFSPWKEHYVAMACAKAARELCKAIPKSKELSRALEIQRDDADPASTQVIVQTRTEKVAEMLGVEASIERVTGGDEIPDDRDRYDDAGNELPPEEVAKKREARLAYEKEQGQLL